MTNGPIAIAKACYEAYVNKDRAAIEALVAGDFHFTSPLDNRIDRATYFMLMTATAIPSTPPATESTTFSVSSCRTRRARPAPTAERTAISRARDVARAICNAATFVHATSNMRNVAALSAHSPGREEPTYRSRSGVSALTMYESPSVCSLPICSLSVASSFVAASIVMPGLINPNTFIERLLRPCA